MSRKNRFKEIKIKPKTYRISGKGNKSIFTDICGIVATLYNYIICNVATQKWLYDFLTYRNAWHHGGDPMPHPFNQAL